MGGLSNQQPEAEIDRSCIIADNRSCYGEFFGEHLAALSREGSLGANGYLSWSDRIQALSWRSAARSCNTTRRERGSLMADSDTSCDMTRETVSMVSPR
jgi:hypothetical protein